MIRQLVPEDSRSYYQIRLQGLALHPEAFGTGAEDWSKATDAQVRDLLGRSTKDDFVLGAFQGESLVGVIGFKREKKHSVRHKGTVWGFFVLSECSGKGLGRSLLQSLVEKVKSQGEIEYIRAVVTVSEKNASRVFRACGFEEYGLEKRGIKEGENFYDQSFLKLDLK